MFTKNRSYLDRGPCYVQLSRFDNMNYLDLPIAKEDKITEYVLSTDLGGNVWQ